AYWLNGRVYSSEMARGLDVLRLVPNEHLSAAEIAAAEAVTAVEINPQTQTRITWADSPDVAEAWLDQLARSPAPAAVTIASPLNALVASAPARAVLDKHLPGLSQNSAALSQIGSMSLA